jgi:phosphate/sulfate permease
VSLGELEDLRQLYAHNYAGEADDVYFERRRHVLASRKTAAVRWNVASDVVLAWIVTLPAAGLFGAAFYELYKLLS